MHEVNTTTPRTDPAEFISDMDGGSLESMLAVALSETAAKVVDHQRAGEVTIKFKFKPIDGTKQLNVEATVTNAHPTTLGKTSNDATVNTVFHVGKGGRLSLVPEAQLSFLDKKTGQLT